MSRCGINVEPTLAENDDPERTDTQPSKATNALLRDAGACDEARPTDPRRRLANNGLLSVCSRSIAVDWLADSWRRKILKGCREAPAGHSKKNQPHVLVAADEPNIFLGLSDPFPLAVRRLTLKKRHEGFEELGVSRSENLREMQLRCD